mmetsp:Transcript_24311/g.47186  ORF Transcript_24311/g.47186 Transcript_24311/m.47186 type:complete len:119 (-) Transcript_24311:191-547(-)
MQRLCWAVCGVEAGWYCALELVLRGGGTCRVWVCGARRVSGRLCVVSRVELVVWGAPRALLRQVYKITDILQKGLVSMQNHFIFGPSELHSVPEHHLFHLVQCVKNKQCISRESEREV